MYLLGLFTLVELMQFSADKQRFGRPATGSMPKRSQVTMVKEGLDSLVQSSRPGKAQADGGRTVRGRRRRTLSRKRPEMADPSRLATEEGNE